MLARTEFKLRYFGSVLGYLWTLVRPLLLFGVLLCRLHARSSTSTATSRRPALPGTCSSRSSCSPTSRKRPRLRGQPGRREGIAAQDALPAPGDPAVGGAVRLFNLGMNLIVVFIFILASGVEPRWSWLELPLLVGAAGRRSRPASACCCRSCTCAFATSSRSGKSSRRSCSTARRSSTRSQTAAKHHLLGISFARILVLNPIGAIITQARHALLQPSAPSAAPAIGGEAAPADPAGDHRRRCSRSACGTSTARRPGSRRSCSGERRGHRATSSELEAEIERSAGAPGGARDRARRDAGARERGGRRGAGARLLARALAPRPQRADAQAGRGRAAGGRCARSARSCGRRKQAKRRLLGP